jgi:hypothetical protein
MTERTETLTRHAQANACMTKYALICADLEEYETALEALVGLANHCLEGNLSKFNAKDFLFKAGMTLLAEGCVCVFLPPRMPHALLACLPACLPACQPDALVGLLVAGWLQQDAGPAGQAARLGPTGPGLPGFAPVCIPSGHDKRSQPHRHGQVRPRSTLPLDHYPSIAGTCAKSGG